MKPPAIATIEIVLGEGKNTSVNDEVIKGFVVGVLVLGTARSL